MPVRNPDLGLIVGEVRPFASLVLPSGWLACNGAAVSRSTYSNLFKALVNQQTARITSSSPTMIGTDTSLLVPGALIVCSGVPAGTRINSLGAPTTVGMSANATATNTGQLTTFHLHGLGDGSTTFNLPDYQGRVLIGGGQGTSLSNRIPGVMGGAETHNLTAAENGPHVHAPSDNSYFAVYGPPDNGPDRLNSGTYPVVRSTATGSSGNGLPHNNMQPFSVAQYGIYAG